MSRRPRAAPPVASARASCWMNKKPADSCRRALAWRDRARLCRSAWGRGVVSRDPINAVDGDPHEVLLKILLTPQLEVAEDSINADVLDEGLRSGKKEGDSGPRLRRTHWALANCHRSSSVRSWLMRRGPFPRRNGILFTRWCASASFKIFCGSLGNLLTSAAGKTTVWNPASVKGTPSSRSATQNLPNCSVSEKRRPILSGAFRLIGCPLLGRLRVSDPPTGVKRKDVPPYHAISKC